MNIGSCVFDYVEALQSKLSSYLAWSIIGLVPTIIEYIGNNLNVGTWSNVKVNVLFLTSLFNW